MATVVGAEPAHDPARRAIRAALRGNRCAAGQFRRRKKKGLREVDRRTRFLTRRLDRAEVIGPRAHHGGEQVYFGATVVCAKEVVEERCIHVMGIDEAGNPKGEVSWISPVARVLPKAWSVTW